MVVRSLLGGWILPATIASCQGCVVADWINSKKAKSIYLFKAGAGRGIFLNRFPASNRISKMQCFA